MEDTIGLLETEAALKPLLEAAQDSTDSVSTIRAVLLKAFSDPDIFCGFDQIKAIVQPTLSLSVGGDGEALLRTLDLFSYGKYSDYENAKTGYVRLTDTQLQKLRQLTVLSVIQEACSRGQGEIQYDILANELGLIGGDQSLRQVEEVVISCVYAHIMDGRLCQKTKSFLVSSQRGPPCRSRDVPFAQVPTMIQTLKALEQRLEVSKEDLGVAHTSVQGSLDQNAVYWKSVEERIKKAETQSAQTGATRSMGGWDGTSAGGSMEASRRSSGSTRRQSKRSRGGMGGSYTEPYQRF
jgi:hypothetical protein